MSRGINKWIGIGNCCADPEVRHSASGAAIASITVACNDSYKDKTTGEKIDKTEFVRVVFFNRLAEIVGEYLKKGSQVYVEGKMQTRKWTDKEGVDRYTTEIVANELQMLGSRADNQGQSPQRSAPPAQQRPMAPSTSGSANDFDSAFDDDIGF